MKEHDKQKQEQLAEIPYQIEIGKAESISIDHVIKNYHTSDTSPFSDHLSSLLSSVKILKEKLNSLLTSIEKNEKVYQNTWLMKELKEVITAYPHRSKELEKILFEENCENAIFNFLSAMIEVNKVVDSVEKINPLLDGKGLSFQNMMIDYD